MRATGFVLESRLGSSAFGGIQSGVASANIIGTTASGDDNMIVSRGSNVEIRGGTSNYNYVVGNRLGIDRAGLVVPGIHSGAGVFINEASWNTVGTNVIANNISAGVKMSGSTHNVVSGNAIGVLPGGVVIAGASQDYGVSIEAGSSENTVEYNLICKNVNAGVRLEGAGVSNNYIVSNTIGLQGAPNAKGVIIGDAVSLTFVTSSN